MQQDSNITNGDITGGDIINGDKVHAAQEKTTAAQPIPKKTEKTWAQRNKANTFWLGVWTAFWVGAVALVHMGPGQLWQENDLLNWGAFTVYGAFSAQMFVATVKYLREEDELNRRVMLHAYAVAAGVGVLYGIGHDALFKAGIVAVEAKVQYMILVMGLTMFISMIKGMRAYK